MMATCQMRLISSEFYVLSIDGTSQEVLIVVSIMLPKRIYTLCACSLVLTRLFAKRHMENYILNAEVRRNKDVVKGINKISDIEKNLKVIRKELEKRRQDMDRLTDHREEAAQQKDLTALAILICDLSNQDGIDVDRIFMDGAEQANERLTVLEMVRMLRLIYLKDNFGPFTVEEQATFNQHL